MTKQKEAMHGRYEALTNKNNNNNHHHHHHNHNHNHDHDHDDDNDVGAMSELMEHRRPRRRSKHGSQAAASFGPV